MLVFLFHVVQMEKIYFKIGNMQDNAHIQKAQRGIVHIIEEPQIIICKYLKNILYQNIEEKEIE